MIQVKGLYTNDKNFVHKWPKHLKKITIFVSIKVLRNVYKDEKYGIKISCQYTKTT